MRLFLPGEPVRPTPRPRPAFGRNRHLGSTRVLDVLNELTGRRAGKVIEHGDGRVDAVTVPDPVRWTAEDVERMMPLNDLRRLLYDRARSSGMTHEEAIGRVFRDGKVTV